MADNPSKHPYIYEGMDPARDKSALDQVGDAIRETVNRASDVIDSAKKPGMPLSVLANIAREAPLGALFAAFLVGVMFGRRG